ncbi:MAG: diguanylate cyclase [Deltaproteobacteria bacterium]|jgi:diguanylate cyclase (GGDEF)-like protein|nr:diguanylate cyclase [Deltaproteobacteria bacterium]
MDNTKEAELERLKKDFLLMEQRCQDEKKCLSNVIYALGRVVALHDELIEEFDILKRLIDPDGELPLVQIENQVETLKNKIFTQETKQVFDDRNRLDELSDSLLKSCRIIKRIMVALVDDFYPTTGELKAKADSIDIKCQEETAQMDLEGPTTAFLTYIRGLKNKISEDFRSINNTFLTLLGHVKELEKTLTSEHGQDVRLKEIEQFETNVNSQVGSIADSFNIHTTIDEIKSAVVEKLTKIKQLVAQRKKEEVEKARKTQESINKLKQRIKKTEKDARTMAKKADYFQTAATKDGLTGLYNRKAFDQRLNDALKTFSEEGKPVSLILFDVDNFKWINDTLGHVAGDKILQKVAHCLGEAFRKGDFIARYGGDEFAVVIEGLTDEIAQKKILDFNDLFSKKRFVSHNIGEINVTVSAGITMSIEGDNIEDFINRADKNMYESKKKKR